MSAPRIIPESEANASSRIQVFPERMEIRAPAGFLAALDSIARRKRTHRAEVIRQILLRGLAEEGAPLAGATTSP